MKDDRLAWGEHLKHVAAFRAWERAFLRDYPAVLPKKGAMTALILNYKRPWNIDLLVRTLLNVPSIEGVLISNNNPAHDMRKWLRVPSGRVRVINQPRETGYMIRLPLSRAERMMNHFLWIDDDIFLRPEQIERLCGEYFKDPSVPHGIYGQAWLKSHFRGGRQRYEGRIDVISRAYVLSRDHVEECFRLAEALDIPEGHPAWDTGLWEDILLSFAGERRPKIHDVGPFQDCPTQGKSGIATWRRPGFHDARSIFYKRLSRIKPLLPDA